MVVLLITLILGAELLDLAYKTDVFVARDEYGAGHVLRTLL